MQKIDMLSSKISVYDTQSAHKYKCHHNSNMNTHSTSKAQTCTLNTYKYTNTYKPDWLGPKVLETLPA